MTATYTPRPGSVADRAIAYLAQHGPATTVELTAVIGCRCSNLHTLLQTAARELELVKTSGARGRPSIWSLPDPEELTSVDVPIQRVIPAVGAPRLDVPIGAASVFAMGMAL